MSTFTIFMQFIDFGRLIVFMKFDVGQQQYIDLQLYFPVSLGIDRDFGRPKIEESIKQKLGKLPCTFVEIWLQISD